MPSCVFAVLICLLPAARLHYQGVDPVVAPEDPKRSGFVLSTRYGGNSATAANVCYDKGKKTLLLYKGGGGKIINKKDRHIMDKVGA